MYGDLQLYKDTHFVLFYGAVTALAVIAFVYLLFRRGNAFAPEVTPPLCLRRLVAVFFAFVALSHVWWLVLAVYHPIGGLWQSLIVASGLDCLTVMPMIYAILLAMLQDRRRPLWLIAVAMAPVMVILAVFYSRPSDVFVLVLQSYFLLLSILYIINMVYALKQYGRWLRDNYADLERKEVWQSIMAAFVCLLIFSFYMSGYSNEAFEYIVQVNDIVLIGLLLWRVETLQRLDPQDDTGCQTMPGEAEMPIPSMMLSTTASSIGQLLDQHCVDAKLYLRHDVRLDDLCKAIGTNRSYLSHYFNVHNTTYNAYINNLRIQHFIRLYRKAVATNRSFTAQQLACESGFRSYSTFGTAFKQLMGMPVTTWMREVGKPET